MAAKNVIYRMVQAIPTGQVATYGQIAAYCGMPRAARFVGQVLKHCDDPEGVPCQRVLYRDGSVAEGFILGGREFQRHLLRMEGVEFSAPYTVDMDRCQWRPSPDEVARIREADSPDH